MTVGKKDLGALALSQKYRLLFGKGKPLNLLTLTQGSAILSGIESPADNWQPSLVFVVAVVCPLELKEQAPAGCSP